MTYQFHDLPIVFPMKVSIGPSVEPIDHEKRSVKPCKSVISMLERVWLSTQVSHRGKYSIERLVALGEYMERTSRTRVLFVCIGTPLPMLVFVLAVECIPLQDPSTGWKGNYGLWIRTSVICGCIASTMLIELQHLIEGVKISIWQVIVVLLCVMVGDTVLCMAVAANLVFPIPFMSILMVLPLLVIVALSLRVALGGVKFYRMLSQTEQIRGFVLFILAQALTLMVYPVYQVLFDAVAKTRYEFIVMPLLPLIKLITKNIVASSIYFMEDMMPESVIFTVEFFNAVYLSICMNRESSTVTLAIILIIDAFHTLLALKSLHRDASKIERLQNQETLQLLDVGLSLLQNREKFEKQEHSQIQLLSCLRHQLSTAGTSSIDRLKRYSWKPTIKAHRKCLSAAAIAPMQFATQTCQGVITKQSLPKINDELTISTNPWMQSLKPTPLSHSLRRTLELLFVTEYLVLSEYLELLIPFFYATIVYFMIHLPSAKYHAELQGITLDNVFHTLLPNFLYGLLKCASFLLLCGATRYSIGVHAFYHLAFVLETQMFPIQSKLIVWMLLTLTCRVPHYGFYWGRE